VSASEQTRQNSDRYIYAMLFALADLSSDCHPAISHLERSIAMNLRTKALSLAVIAAVALMGCGKEAPLPPPVQTAPTPTPAANPSTAPATVASAPALSVKDLAAKSGCLACHAVDKKLIGPAYQDVAKKYKASDEAMLVAKVKAGSKGVWGPIAMPPNVAVKDEDIKTLVNWILAGAK
jgi:cytochrome c